MGHTLSLYYYPDATIILCVSIIAYTILYATVSHAYYTYSYYYSLLMYDLFSVPRCIVLSFGDKL